MNLTTVWLIVFVACILIELITLGLTTIWFAGGALIAAIGAAFGAPLWLQAVLFGAVSLVLLYFTRPVAVKYFNKDRVKTNAESLVGKQAIVISEIDNLQGIGQVTVGGQRLLGAARLLGHLHQPADVGGDTPPFPQALWW